MSGYWKIWHDMSGRFIVAACLVVWQVYAAGPLSLRNSSLNVQNKALPRICIGAALGQHEWEGARAKQNYEIQSSFCKVAETPNPAYTTQVINWITNYESVVWQTTMPVLMLFLGILLAVGSPFGGESSESSVLTFSLPWTRMQWLRTKFEMTGGLMAGLIAFVMISGRLMYQLPGLGVLNGIKLVTMPGLFEVFPSFLAGMAGITFGITATLITRNALAGAISASIAAYVLGLFPMGRNVIMDFTTPVGIFVALLIIATAVSITYYKLEQAEF